MNSSPTHPLDTIAIDPACPVVIPPEKAENIRRLIQFSHRSFMDVDSVLPWGDGIDRNQLPKDETTSWIYGTRYWDVLTAEQRLEMMWHECARDVSMFIWLEQTLPPLYVGYVNTYQETLCKEVYEYLMIFSKEEIVHTLMFRRFMDLAGLDIYSPPASPYISLLSRLPKLHPAIGILWTLTIEWAAELVAMHGTQGNGVEPIVRGMFHAHHVEELRHITFGRRIIESFFNTASHSEQEVVRNQFSPVLRNLYDMITFNPEITTRLSFPFPADVNDPSVIEEIRQSPNNIQMNKLRFREQRDWFVDLGLCA
ncbi:diiron oxygenase [Burkholderia stabilis]|uniref:diiron oxygenase n=1 Tax=Burkholderia stabilis TaxID=95485 RepID=UPI00158B4917|nr:diiron oxygenase [Burkholderia stabilis]